MKKLYLLERKNDDVGYDEYDAKIVRASTPTQARHVACQKTGDEGNVWINADKVRCRIVPIDGPEEEILGSFCAG